MSRESSNRVARQIQTLYASGPVAGLTDRQLIDRFLARDGSEREDAFGALVQRHGPIVLRVCRRMLSSPNDAEDAFQAVFLVLARKAGAIGKADALESWLYGVAVRTSKESRRRSAIRQAREGGRMDESRLVALPDDDRRDLLALLDEEIAQLPNRFRSPLILCELEGASRQNAARQLGLPEGTLSSRLARGRLLLKDRLARRGVGSLPAVLVSETSTMLPTPLVESTVRLALKFVAGGTVPAAVSILAEGVLGMIAASKLKLILVICVLTGSAGLAWAVVPKPIAAPPGALPSEPAVRKEIIKKPLQRGVTYARGVVVDEAGQPVAGAEVRSGAYTNHDVRDVSGPDGTFAIPIAYDRLDGTNLLARSPKGDRIGVFRFGYQLSRAEAETPARIVLKLSREITVHVVDSGKVPISGAVTEIIGHFGIHDEAKTGPDGDATLQVPVDAKVEWIVGLKSGMGFDYAEFGPIDGAGRTQGGALAADLPASVDLTLDGAHTVRIKTVDRDEKPLAGIALYPWLLRTENRRSFTNFVSRIVVAKTDSDGVATFDWLPPEKGSLQFFPADDRYARNRIMHSSEDPEFITTRMTRTEFIHGRVTRPDGTPAGDVMVRAFGSGQGTDHGQSQIRTAEDGSYRLKVNAREVYAVSIDDKDWAAPSRLDVAVYEGKPVDGVDFKLTRGTILRGTVTVGPGNRPAAKEYIRIDESGGNPPEEFREKGDRYGHQVRRQFGESTDSQGRYAIRLGPGSYTVFGPPRTKDEKITVKDEPEIVLDFQMPRAEKGPLAGRVVTGADNKGFAGAKVQFVAANRMSIPREVIADAEGRFQCERDLDRLTICAKSPDGSLGAIVEIGAEDPEVTIKLAPTAVATGLLLDEQGKPAANQKLEWGRRVYMDAEEQISMTCFAPIVKTDAEGRFTLPALVVGQRYTISVQRDNRYPSTGMVEPERPGPMDLGTLQIGAYKPTGKEAARLNAEEQSSFLKSAPDTGKVAPPIEATTLEGKPLKLSDLKGKFVLPDFWATWCGPCIGEIPQLQAVHDAFGKDERFVLLSLSVDEKIDAPKTFQEKRKLPWRQAFLGVGIHGPTPASFGIRAIPAFVLVGPDGKIVARGMRREEIMKAVAKALGSNP